MIYADHAATCPPLPVVRQLLTELLAAPWGNPSAINHAAGRAARAQIDRAREQVLAAISGGHGRLIFTSGATEALNLAIFGVAERLIRSRPRVVTISSEHPAVLAPCRLWRNHGGTCVELPVDGEGRVDLDRLAEVVDQGCGLVCAMLVNNQTGVYNDLAAISTIAHRHGALVLCDATQALGRVPVAVADLGCDFLACTGHKLGGLPGAGALWIRHGLALGPLQHGGQQEMGLRPGTENHPGIAAFGLAAEYAASQVSMAAVRYARLSAELESALVTALPGLRVYGSGATRAPGFSFVGLPGLPRGWLSGMHGVACSGGSACATGSPKPSSVLIAMGVDEATAGNSLRLVFGPHSQDSDPATIAGIAIAAAQRLRGDDG